MLCINNKTINLCELEKKKRSDFAGLACLQHRTSLAFISRTKPKNYISNFSIRSLKAIQV